MRCFGGLGQKNFDQLLRKKNTKDRTKDEKGFFAKFERFDLVENFVSFVKERKKRFFDKLFFRDQLDKFVALAQLSRAYCIIICTQTHNMWPKITSIIM